MANYTELFKALSKATEKLNRPIKDKGVKFIVRLSILPGERPTISTLKRRLLGAKAVAAKSDELATTGSRFTPKGMLEIHNQINKAKKFYLTPQWKERAMKYAGMTDKEAEATAKFLSSNISRHSISTRPLVSGPLKGTTINDYVKFKSGNYLPSSGVGVIRISVPGIFSKTPIHEAHHAAMLSNGAFIPSQLGVTDINVINGMNKFNRHIAKLGSELASGIKPETSSKFSPEHFQYITKPIEIRSRMLTGLTEGYTPSEIPNNIDSFRKFVDPNVYENVAKKMLVAVPVGVGLANYANNN